jgi:hypothetical protein
MIGVAYALCAGQPRTMYDGDVPPSGPPVAQPATAAADSDTTRLDTLSARLLRDSLVAERERYAASYDRAPAHIDSIANPWRLYPWQLHNADAAGISECLRFSPCFVTIPYSLSSSANRALYLGYPMPRSFLTEPAEASLPSADPLRGSDALFVTDVQQVIVTPGQLLRFERRSLPTVAPFTFLSWENGVFGENTLRVLFARPFTPRLSLGVTSNFRYFSAKSYDHSSGNIHTSYTNLWGDSSLVAGSGTNPLTREHTAGARLQWTGRDGSEGYIRYNYLGLRNGRAYGPTSPTLSWDTVYQYVHDVGLSLAQVVAGPLRLDIDAFLRNDVGGSARVVSATPHTVQSELGKQFTAGGSLGAAANLSPADTLSATLESRYRRKTLYDNSEWNISESRAACAYGRHFGAGRFEATARAGVGEYLTTINEQWGSATTWNGRVSAALAGQTLALYARRDALPWNPPLEPADVVRSEVPDILDSYGADLWLHSARLGLLTGYCYSTGVDSATLAYAWSEGTPPYQEPHSVLTIAPAVGPFLGLTLYGRYLLSDARPFHKAQAGLAWAHTTANGNERICLDAAVDYWSVRDPVLFGGISTWNREVLDVYAKAAFQFRSFRLFMRVDNVLNRKFAYVPGYFMPGLTFRWGFNWYFQR